jgi:CRISPR/Cas system-associated exonuclease Cas4 (RecB family)
MTHFASPTAASRRAAAVAFLRASPERTLFLASSTRAAVELVAEAFPAGTIAVSITTPRRLADEASLLPLAQAGRRAARRAELEAYAAAVVRDVPTPARYVQSARTSGFPAALVAAFLRSGNSGPNPVDVYAWYTEWRSRLTKDGLAIPDEVFAAAVAAPAPRLLVVDVEPESEAEAAWLQRVQDACTSAGGSVLIVETGAGARDAAREFEVPLGPLHALLASQAAGASTDAASVASVASLHDRVHFFAAPSASREAMMVARRIRALLKRGVSPREIGVVARRVPPVAGALAAAFRRAGLPTSTVLVAPPARPFLGALALVDLLRGLDLPRVEAFIASGAAAFAATPAAQVTLRDLLRPAKGLVGRAAFLAYLTRALPEPSGSGPAVSRDASVSEFAGGRERTGPSGSGPSADEAILGFQAWLERAVPLLEGGQSVRGFATVVRSSLAEPWAVLDALAAEIELSEGEASPERLAARLRGRFVKEKYVVPERRAGIFVGDPEALRARSFAHLFVIGLAERCFPEKQEVDPFSGESGDEGRERRAFLRVIGAAGDELTLSYPRIDDSGRPLLPSLYRTALLHELGATEEAHRESLAWPAPEDPADAADRDEFVLAELAAALRTAPTATPVKVGPPSLATPPPAISLAVANGRAPKTGALRYVLGYGFDGATVDRALRMRAHRALRKWTLADGFVDAGAAGVAALAKHQLTARSFSPTALQNFAACPYKFLLSAIFRLSPPEDRSVRDVIDPLVRGTLVHEVLFRFLLQARDGGKLPLKGDDRTAHFESLLQILGEEEANARARGAAFLPVIWDDMLHEVVRDLEVWLDAQIAHPAEPLYFELAFGLAQEAGRDPRSVVEPVQISGDGATPTVLLARGSVDLVERRPDGALVAVDHKTGKTKVKAGVVTEGGTVLQPVVYSLVLEKILGPSGAAVAGGELYYCTHAGDFTRVFVPLDDRARAAFGTVASTVDGALREGFLPRAPGEYGCRYCDFQTICGEGAEQIAANKRQERLVPLQTLRRLP